MDETTSKICQIKLNFLLLFQNTIISWNTYENSITLRNLFPYSTYKIEIVDLSSGKIERTVEIDTPSGKPQFSPIKYVSLPL